MKKFGLLLVTCSLLLTACTQSEKKVPNFSRVTNRLSKVALTQENVVGASSSTSDKKASSQKSSTKKKEDKETKTETANSEQKLPSKSNDVLAKNRQEVKNKIFDGLDWDALTEEEKRLVELLVAHELREDFQRLQEQGYSVAEIHALMSETFRIEGLPQEAADIIGRQYENYLSGSIASASTMTNPEDEVVYINGEAYPVHGRGWAYDSGYSYDEDTVEQGRGGWSSEDSSSIEEMADSFVYDEPDYSSDWSPTYDNYTDYEPVEAIEPIIEGEN